MDSSRHFAQPRLLPIFAFLAALISLTGAAQALACPVSSASIMVPAVVGQQGGGLLRLTVRTEPGNGSVLTTIVPIVGPATQASQSQAVSEAFRGLQYSQNQCEVEFFFSDPNGAPSVDGPSAGMAMTVALRAALTNKTVRRDISITGEILPGGKIGLVGGIIDKAQASARYGLHAILTPKQEIYENIVLTRLGTESNFTAAEIGNLDEAMAIATAPDNTPVTPKFSLKNRVMPDNLPAREQNGNDLLFAKVAMRINSAMENRTLASGIGAKPPYSTFFRTEISQNERLISMGYGYTAANNAFLSQVDAAFLNLPSADPDVEAEMAVAKGCIDNAPRPAVNSQNLEWVAGGTARLNWARQKLDDVNKTLASAESSSSEDRYTDMREIYYAEGWCQAGSELNTIAGTIEGSALNDTVLEGLARRRVDEEAALLAQNDMANGDAEWHWTVANRSLAEKDYAAALFDAAYISGSQAAAIDNLNSSGSASARQALRIADTPMKTVWGRTYQSQGAFIIAQGNSSETGAAGANQVLRIAQAMEDEFGLVGNSTGMDTGVKAVTPPPAIKPAGMRVIGFPDALEVAVAVSVVLAVLLLGVSIGRRMKERRAY